MSNRPLLTARLAAYLEYWKTGDKESWMKLFAEDAILTDPVGTPSHVGSAAISSFWDRVHQLPMTFHPELGRMVLCENEALLLFRMVTRPESGPGFAMDIADTFRFNDDGFITELKAYWDSNSSSMVD